MTNLKYGDEEEYTTEDGEISSEEEGFLRGFEDEEEAVECDECGSAVHEEAVRKVIDGEAHTFCSDTCATDFEETL